jgi:hypothetical protein
MHTSPTWRRLPGVCLALAFTATLAAPAAAGSGPVDYVVLATNRTSTMEKELNQSAELGYRFDGVMGGNTAFGGNEVVAVMSREAGSTPRRYRYRLLATSKTSTMQRELQNAADAGYEYRGQTVFESLFGGKEVVAILERDEQGDRRPHEYKLLATSRTSTLQKELARAGEQGYAYVGITVGETALGGRELVVVTRRIRE